VEERWRCGVVGLRRGAGETVCSGTNRWRCPTVPIDEVLFQDLVARIFGVKLLFIPHLPIERGLSVVGVVEKGEVEGKKVEVRSFVHD